MFFTFTILSQYLNDLYKREFMLMVDFYRVIYLDFDLFVLTPFVQLLKMTFINFYNLCCFYCIIIVLNTWKASNIMANFSNLIQNSDLRGQLIIKTTLEGSPHLIVFGGYGLDKVIDQKILYNSLYKINLQTTQAKQIAVNKITKPSSRHGACGVIVRDKLFIYGGYAQSDMLSNELFEYDFLTDEWTPRGNSYNFTQCKFMIITNEYQNDTVAIVGILETYSTFQIVEYLILNETFSEDILILNYNSIEMRADLWDGTQENTYLRIQSAQDQVSDNYYSNPQIHFPVNFFCVTTHLTNYYILVTNNGIYYLVKVGKSYQIRFWKQHNGLWNEKIACQGFNNWYFFIYNTPSQKQKGKQVISLQYLYSPTSTGGLIHKDKKTIYIPWINNVQFSTYMSYDDSIFIINQNLQAFYLNQSCDSYMVDNPNVQKCAFGMFACKQGYTGKTCSINECSGSLRLLDANLLTQTQITCSGNGECLPTGCECYQNWGGQSCQIYQKKNCKGTLIKNFISTNCECNDPTVGGNQCNVVFCYNDCSNQGKCRSNGQCQCNVGYTGPDCSILKITFSLI